MVVVDFYRINVSVFVDPEVRSFLIIVDPRVSICMGLVSVLSARLAADNSDRSDRLVVSLDPDGKPTDLSPISSEYRELVSRS